MDAYLKAYDMKDEIIKHRRVLHQIPEIGMELENTTAYVKEQLIQMGYEPEEIIKNGIVATVGTGGKVIMIRADMDALPMKEESALEFASKNGNTHACGHDAHTAMLLGTAKILKEYEDNLEGTVKILFQPGEEVFLGAKAMIEAGALENPKVDAAITCHINSTLDTGVHLKTGTMNASSNNFKITIAGKACHGAMPYNGVDPVIVGSSIVLGLQELTTREVAFNKNAVITIGHFEAGKVGNAIPGEAILEGTMRTFDTDTLDHLAVRIPEVVEGIAKVYRAEAKFEYVATVPVAYNDDKLTNELTGYVESMSQNQERFKIHKAIASNGSEDFALYARDIPGFSFRLGAPDLESDTIYPLHNPKMKINEDMLPLGSAIHAQNAIKWLENNK